MRLTTYIDCKRSRASFEISERLIPVEMVAGVTGLARGAEFSCARSVLELGRDTVERMHETAQELLDKELVEGVARDSVTLTPPVRTPEKIICAGLNYRAHAAESGRTQLPDSPPLFAKFGNALIGHGAPIELPLASRANDYEGELAFVIGETCKHVPESRALDVVAGYTVFNDVSARDLQTETGQWLAGKALDTFAPCGPSLVSLDELSDPESLDLTTRLNGMVVQDTNTNDMIFGVRALVAFISSIMTLRTGDVVATGTPSGVGYAKKPPRYLQEGDIVEIEIAGVGVLSNPVIDAAAATRAKPAMDWGTSGER